MPDVRSPQEQSGCRSILIRLIFRSSNAEQYRAWMARRPVRLVVTFTHTKKPYERESVPYVLHGEHVVGEGLVSSLVMRGNKSYE